MFILFILSVAAGVISNFISKGLDGLKRRDN